MPAPERSHALAHQPTNLITLNYRTRGARAAIFAIIAFIPIWGIWAPYALWLVIDNMLKGPAGTEMQLVFLGTALLLCAVGYALWACLDTRILIDSDGITFPIRFSGWTGYLKKIPWSQLQAVIYRPNAAEELRSRLVLKFTDATVPLVVGGLTKEDLRKLVFAAQSYSGSSIEQPAALKAPSFTEIWENELSSRFSPTVFVPLQPGTRLKDGSIEVLGQSACGGLSAIYMARMDGQKVILKEAVAPARADDTLRLKALELFAREASLLKTLDHPRISKVLDHFSESDRHYLVLENVAGTDLRRFIRDNGRQHEELVLRWAMDVADVLEYLHRQTPPVIHRDLTPDNLIFTANGGIHVIDFGAANAFVSDATGTLVGKQSYIAPEQFRGRATPQSDIYSLGATMHFLLTGVDPEPLTVSQPASLNSEVSPLADQLIARCTALELSDRIESAGVLSSRLRSVVNQRRSAAKAGGM